MRMETARLILRPWEEADAQALYQHGVDGLYAIADGPITLQESSARAEELLERTAESVVRTVLAAQRRR